MTVSQIPLVAACVVCALGAGTDLRTGHIPNTLTLGPVALAPFAYLAWGWAVGGARLGLESAGLSLLGVVVCVALPLALYAIGAMFGGDVKLFGAVGAICLPRIGFEAVVYTFIAAVPLSILTTALQGNLKQMLANTLTLATNPFRSAEKRRPLSQDKMTLTRFGPAIFAGVAAATFLHWQDP